MSQALKDALNNLTDELRHNRHRYSDAGYYPDKSDDHPYESSENITEPDISCHDNDHDGICDINESHGDLCGGDNDFHNDSDYGGCDDSSSDSSDSDSGGDD